MENIIIRAIDNKTKKEWDGATYLEAIFCFYDAGSLELEMLKDDKWVPIEIIYKEEN